MMNYCVEYRIVKGYYKDCLKRDNIAFLGVFTSDIKRSFEDDSLLVENFVEEEFISFKVCLGGGVNFPKVAMAREILAEHIESIKKFINSIKEEKILIFNTLEFYTHVIFVLLCEQLDTLNKEIIFLVDKYVIFLQTRKDYKFLIAELEEYKNVVFTDAMKTITKDKETTLVKFNRQRGKKHKEKVIELYSNIL